MAAISYIFALRACQITPLQAHHSGISILSPVLVFYVSFYKE